MIEQLPVLRPNPVRSARTRERCHAKLMRKARPRPARRLAVERAICLGFGAIYLSSLAFDVVRVLIR